MADLDVLLELRSLFYRWSGGIWGEGGAINFYSFSIFVIHLAIPSRFRLNMAENVTINTIPKSERPHLRLQVCVNAYLISINHQNGQKQPDNFLFFLNHIYSGMTFQKQYQYISCVHINFVCCKRNNEYNYYTSI